jgi:phosphatidylglycerol:prolipoprotein diacylglycerol transferase
MYPVLLETRYFVIHTYGFFIALGFLSAIFISKREARIAGEDPEKIADLIFWILVAAIIGSRIFYVIVYWNDFYPNKLVDVFKLWEGGLVFYGGFIGAVLVALGYSYKLKLNFLKMADVLSPAIPFGHFLGRLGCFSAGCCHGKACSLPWSVTFTNPESLAPLNITLHPSQLYESFANFLIFLFIINYKRFKKFDGQVFLSYIIIYAVTRSYLETLRGDYRGAEIFGILSVSQTVALVLGLSAAGLMYYLYNRKKSVEK